MDYTNLVNDAKNGLSLIKLEKKYGYCKRHVCKILRLNGLTTKGLSYNRILSDEQKSILRGSLLGDSCITKAKSGKCRMRFVHGPKQYDYLDWKYEKIKDIVLTPPRVRNTPKAFGSESKTFVTQVNRYITDLYCESYKNGIKFIDKKYLHNCDTLAIAVWVMDDGYLYKNGGSLSTHGFSISENRIIAKFLSERYKVKEPKLSLDKRCDKFCIRLSSELSRRIANDVYEIISNTPSMSYKVDWHG